MAVDVTGNDVYVADSENGLLVLQTGQPVASLSYASDNTYRMDLGQTLLPDRTYLLQIGPGIYDTNGMAMDQDQDGAAGEIPEDLYGALFTTVNHAPTDLTLSASEMPESQVCYTAVGYFATVDPDADEAFTYTLVSGKGATNNSSFTIRSDGSLVLQRVLDYETQSSYPIRVRATDRGGLWCEKSFTILVTDVREFASPAVYDRSTSTFYVTGGNASGASTSTFAFGVPGADWKVLTGDWDGDGLESVGFYDPAASMFHFTDTCATGEASGQLAFGIPGAGWMPLVGDRDGDDATEIGLYDPLNSVIYLGSSLSSGFAQYTIPFGVPNAGWQPLAGNWNGWSGVGLYDPTTSTFYRTIRFTTGVAEYGFIRPECQTVAGCRWWANGTATRRRELASTTLRPPRSTSATGW